MSSVVISGNTSGAVTLSVPDVAGTNTATLPAATGTVMVSGNMPAFGAYPTTGNVLSANTTTKVTFDAEEFDTANCFASSRFTPNVAGYYQINAAYQTGTTTGYSFIMLYKNGSIARYGSVILNTAAGVEPVLSSLIFLNGTTDYVEIYAYTSVASTLTVQSQNTYVNGYLARAA